MKHLFFLLIIAAECIGLNAQPLAITSVNSTPSVCFNDGSLIVNVSGGTSPYQYSIISGPVVQNVTYPILNGGFNSFLSLHAGTYVIQVVDNAHDTVTYTSAVSGNYQFPTLSYNISSDTIYGYPAQGRGPYSYAISTSGPNGPFGAYQDSSFFPNLCNGSYYVRVKDSCGNFYTAGPITVATPPASSASTCTPSGSNNLVSVQIYPGTGNPPYTYTCVNGSFRSTNTTGNFTVPATHVCPDTVYAYGICHDTLVTYVDCHPLSITAFCSNFSDSTAFISAAGGSPPYTYQFYQFNSNTNSWVLTLSQDSGHFTHLHYTNINTTVGFSVVDACGRSTSISNSSDSYMTITHTTTCPFDGTVTIHTQGAFMPDTITCTSCIPVQVANSMGQLTGLDTGTYTIHVADACGENRNFIIHLEAQHIIAKYVYTSCNSFLVTAYGTNGSILYGCTFTLFKLDSNTHAFTDSLYQDTTGIFNHLANGIYQVIIRSPYCLTTQLVFNIPYFESFCLVPYFTPSCQLKLIVNYNPSPIYIGKEDYTLMSANGTIFREGPGIDTIRPFNVDTGKYTLVSDSGCSQPQEFSYSYKMVGNAYGSCLNQGGISLSPLNTNYPLCPNISPYTYSIQSDSFFESVTPVFSSGVTFPAIPSGTYIAKAYFSNIPVLWGDSIIQTGDSTCLLDSTILTVPNYNVPSIIVQNINTCDTNSFVDIPFRITGGFRPYYVSIAGQSSTTTDSMSGVLTHVPPGSYTMVISDTCGISTSVSVSVIDTCVSCSTVHANFTMSDSLGCVGQNVSFHNIYTQGLNYYWTDNGTLFSDSVNPSLTITSTGDQLIQCVVRYYNCRDTFSAVIHASPPPVFNLGNDTSYCNSFSRVLSTGLPNTQWSTGANASSITVNSPGTYWARISSFCGTFTDSITISDIAGPSISFGSDTILCSGDSLVLNPHSNGSGYRWSDGSVNSTLAIYAPGEYSVTVSLSGCQNSDSIFIQLVESNPKLLTADTTLCAGEYLVLSPKVGTNPVWQDGSRNSTYRVSEQGLYIVMVNTICGNVTDSVEVGFIVCASTLEVPDAFTPNGDGMNDRFTVFGVSIAEYEIRIYNRWGELVYDSRNPDELNDLSRGWDGSYKGKMQNAGAFAYYITAKGDDGKDFFKKGEIILIR